MKYVQLSGLVNAVETWNPNKCDPDDSFQYIDLSAIDQKSKSIVGARQIECGDAPSRARQLVRAGDILVSTVRPNLNGVAKVPDELDGATASTGFCVLRPNPELLDGNFLFQWVKGATFVGEMVKQATGASYPAVSDRIVLASSIPLPSVLEQRRIAAILDQADALRVKRRDALAQLDSLTHSIFIEMFGDPIGNPRKWEIKRLKAIAETIVNGTTPNGGSQVYVEEGVVFFRSQNVWKNSLILDDIAYIDEKTHSKMSKSSLRNKDILITKTGRINTENSSLGRAAMFTGKDNSANINGHVYLVRLSSGAVHKFVLYILTTDSYREYIRSVCVGGIDKRQINKEHLEEFPIIYPPLDLQHRFAASIELIEREKNICRTQLAEFERMFASLLHRAFQGAL